MADVTNQRIPLSQLSAFYNNITMMANSGISLADTFSNFSKTETNQIRREQYKIISNQVKLGQNLVNVLQKIQLLPDFDLPLLKAALEMGRIPQLTKKLATQYENLESALSKIKGQMFNPIFSLGLAFLSFDLPDLISEKISGAQFLLRVAPRFIIAVAVAGGIYWIWQQSQVSRVYRKKFYGALSALPGINRFILQTALQRFCIALELGLETGLDLYQSLTLAGDSSGHDGLETATQRLIPMIQQGVGLETAIAIEDVFPKEFVIAVNIGLTSGRMPEAIGQYRTRLELEIQNNRNKIVKIFPVIIQICVAAYIGSMLLDFWQARFNQISSD